jgi:hypothetical protein
LDDPDKELERRGHRFVRHADDFELRMATRKRTSQPFGKPVKTTAPRECRAL